MTRREFITLLGGAAAASPFCWPLTARAQQGERVRQIGVLMANYTQADREGQARIAAFLDTFRRLGWNDGRNVRIEYRWDAGDAERIKISAEDLVRSAPDAIVVQGNPAVAALHRLTSTLPAILFGSDSAANFSFMRAAEAVAPSLGIALTNVDVQGGVEIERAIAAFASQPDGGVIVVPHPKTIADRGSIIILAARHRLPAIYPFRYFAAEGGLMSYGPDQIDQWRGAASYVDRILRGEKPGELPVQAPTKFELVINMKTAKALGLTIPPAFPLRADEVIE